MNSKPTAKPKDQTVLLAYIPVLHEGYRRFFEKHLCTSTRLYVLGSELTHQYRPLVKDIRALEPELIAQALQQWYQQLEVQVLDAAMAASLQITNIITPDEDISRQVVERYFPEATVHYDNIFLRWDHQKSLAAEAPHNIPAVSASEFQRSFLALAQTEAQKSSDWWRRVGAVLVSSDGQLVLADHNHHLPSPHAPYVAGDPRANFHKGEQIELTTAIHAEAAVIGTAAKQGVPTEGARLYVTTFPCPVCAKLIAQAGIAELYFEKGYAMLDGWEVLKEKNIIISNIRD